MNLKEGDGVPSAHLFSKYSAPGMNLNDECTISFPFLSVNAVTHRYADKNARSKKFSSAAFSQQINIEYCRKTTFSAGHVLGRRFFQRKSQRQEKWRGTRHQRVRKLATLETQGFGTCAPPLLSRKSFLPPTTGRLPAPGPCYSCRCSGGKSISNLGERER